MGESRCRSLRFHREVWRRHGLLQRPAFPLRPVGGDKGLFQGLQAPRPIIPSLRGLVTADPVQEAPVPTTAQDGWHSGKEQMNEGGTDDRLCPCALSSWQKGAGRGLWLRSHAGLHVNPSPAAACLFWPWGTFPLSAVEVIATSETREGASAGCHTEQCQVPVPLGLVASSWAQPFPEGERPPRRPAILGAVPRPGGGKG